MLTSNPPSAPHTHRPKPSIRKPLKPINISTPPSNQITQIPPNCQKNNTSILNDYREPNKENCRVVGSPVESFDASLAEELNAAREKMERLRLDREKTEKFLQERQKILDFQLYELEERGEFQRELEIEVDRLFRLKQLKFVSESHQRMSPIRSLREKAMEKKSHEGLFEIAITEDSKLESVDESRTAECSSMATSSSIDFDIDSIVKSVTDLAKIELRKRMG